MQEHNFDKILDFLCSGIAMKSEQERVRDELYDHLMCKYETNIACGLDEEQAVESAIKDLGDVKKMKKDLGSVHGFAPKPAMKKAMEYLFVGYVFLVINFWQSGFYWEIFRFLLTIVFLTGLFCLSKANKKLKTAFYFRSASFVISCLMNAFMADWFEVFNFNIPFGIINFVLSVIFWSYLTGGLYELVKPYESITPMKKKLNICFAVNIIFDSVQLLLYTVYYKDNNYGISMSGWGFLLFFAVAMISAFVTFFIFRSVSNLLFDSDHEYKTEVSASKKTAVVIISLLVGILPAVCVDVGYSLQKAETMVHTIDDSDISQAEYSRICKNLLSYGIPEELVYSLPESEIERYADSLDLSEIDKPTQNYYSRISEAELDNFDGVIVETNSWAVVLKDGNIRVLSYMKYIEGSKGFIDGAFWDSSLTPSVREDGAGFVLILSKENGAVVRNEPIETYIEEHGSPYGVNGACFEAKDGLTVIFAQTFTDNEPQRYNYIINSYVRKTPFAFLCRKPYDAYYMPKYETFEYAHNQGFVDFRSGEPLIEIES